MTSGTSERLSARNPYVGPRSIQQGEKLYGRSAEIRELYNRLQARRIVVLHSPSGAGKSSLVEAGLIPKLKAAKFDVWKPIRVNLDPRGIEGVPEGTNRYLLSAMVSLEEELPANRRRSPAELASLDFLTCLESRPRRKSRENRPVVLLFDQFEEVLTAAPRAVEAKREFFSAVGEALDTGDYWALFIIREDYLAAFSPYRDRIPTQMSNTFRLDLLGLDGAREAAEQPAIAGGRTFPAVDQLIRDLSTTKVQQPDGSFVVEQGLYVEPVQLQVVCHRLWEAMPDDDLSIDPDDIAQYGGISESLASYYSQAVRKIADGDPAFERQIREWVGDKLIVEGIRSQVRQETRRSAGLDNVVIDQLLSSYLVRTEQRAGSNWFELSHDRLVDPVRHDNEVWEQEHLHPLQVQTKLWVIGQRASALLLSAEALPDAVDWAQQNAALLTPEEQDFLRHSLKLRAKTRRKRKTLAAVAVVSVAATLGMGVVVKFALDARAAAEEAKELAEQAREKIEALNAVLDAQSAKNMARTPGERIHGLTKALELRADASLPPTVPNILEASIFAATQSLHDVYELRGHKENIIDLAFSPDGERLATASRDNTAKLWSNRPPHQLIKSLEGYHDSDVEQVEFSPDSGHVLTVGSDGKAALWRTDEPGPDASPDLVPLDPGCKITTAKFTPDGETLAIGCDDGEICLWSVGANEADRWLPLDDGSGSHDVSAIGFSPDGMRLVATHERARHATLINLETNEIISSLRGHKSPITALAFSADGDWIATGSEDGSVKLWEGDSGALVDDLGGDQGEVSVITFAPDSSRLATVGVTRIPTLWQLDSCHSKQSLMGHTAKVSDAAFSPDGKLLATVGYDQTLRLWDANTGRSMVSLESPSGLLSVAFSPDSTHIATGDLTGMGDPMVRVWDAKSNAQELRIENPSEVKQVALSPDGGRVAMAEEERVSVWDTQTGQKLRDLPHAHVGRLTFSGRGRELATWTGARDWKLWDVEAGTEFKTKLPKEVTAVAFSQDGMSLATADQSDNVGLWSPYSDERAGTIGAPRDDAAPSDRRGNSIAYLALSRGGMIAGARFKGEVIFWDGTGKRINDEKMPNLQIRAIAFSPIGGRLAVATAQEWVWVFDVESGEIMKFQNNNPDVRSVAFSPDERYLVTGNGTAVTLWDLRSTTPEQVATIGDHEDLVRATEFSGDGRSVLSSSTDGIVIEWLISAQQRHAFGCEVVLHSPVAYEAAVEICSAAEAISTPGADD